MYLPPEPPQPPDFTDIGNINPAQLYLGPSTSNGGANGVDAFVGWGVSGGDGAGIAICDIEYDWHLRHGEFRANLGLRMLGNDPLNPFGGPSTRDHGTSVVGIYGSRDNGVGTKGIAFNAAKFCASVFTQNPIPFYNIPGAISAAMATLSPGDIIVLEQHIPGPNHDPAGPSQNGFVPVEWDRSTYDSVRTATSNGFIVVEAAGNGGQNLDANVYRNSDNHRPFRTENGSGAILVGAGDPRTRQRLAFSNFGSRVDVQAWGRNVLTTAYDATKADAWSSDGPNLLYTSRFSGTSSATPIVAGVCASLQGIHLARFGRVATVDEILQLLLETDSAQAGNLSQHIGPLPNLRRSIGLLDRSIPRQPEIDPASGSFPLPCLVSIYDRPGNTQGYDFKTWYTTDGTDPVEGAANSRQVIGYGFEELRLNMPATQRVRARTFFTADLNGERVSSPTTQANIVVYRPVAGPTGVRASNGEFIDKIVISWNPLPPATHYDVFLGPAMIKLNSSPIVTQSFDHQGALGSAGVADYYVRATLANDRVTAFSGPARGRYGLAPLTVTASKGDFPDYVLVAWSYPAWNPFSKDIEFEVFRSTIADFSQAESIARIQPKTRSVPVGNRVVQVSDGIDTEYKDTSAQPNQNYAYWVLAREPNRAYETPLSNSEIGFRS
ncbi:hypothetical protein GCM10022236_42820 [Microlunatus ginsengisoli]|uniref:Peptidase S8/S53 domain-containing protein n=1 Tax=Microlunatus ginsengisoli TaxID=363863 RepID=A0ABP7AMR2_9ACTN